MSRRNKPPNQSVDRPDGPNKEVLHLKHCHASFRKPTPTVSVFFDECNRELVRLTRTPGSKTRVTFQQINKTSEIEFTLPIERKVLSIKLNPSKTVLAYHIERNIVEFINVSYTANVDGSRNYNLDDKRYNQPSRAKNSKLFGFLWVSSVELVMVTDICIEYYHLDANRKRLRFLKSFASSTNWFVFQPICSYLCNDTSQDSQETHSILMVSTGSASNSIQPYLFRRRNVTRLARFEVETDWNSGVQEELLEHSISLVSLYGSIRLLVLQHQSLNVKTKGAQILIFTVDTETGFTTNTHTLDLDVDGKFAINILNNLVVAHDQPSRTSFIFDIKMDNTEKSDCQRHYVSFLNGQSISPLVKKDGDGHIELYSADWVFFQPNFIIDSKQGYLLTLHIDFEAMLSSIQDDQTILKFLAYRKNSEQFILSRVKDVVSRCYLEATSTLDRQTSPLADVATVFELLSKLVAPAILVHQAQKSSQKSMKNDYVAVIRQEDIFQEIFGKFEPLEDKDMIQLQIISMILQEFILYTRQEDKSVESCIYEMLLKCLMKSNNFYQVFQMIRAGIFEDSKQLACLLLSYRDGNKEAARLGIEMLERMDCLGELSSIDLEDIEQPTRYDSNLDRISHLFEHSFDVM